MGQWTKSGRATRTVAFVITATDHGTLILNRLDRHQTPDSIYGVGNEILEHFIAGGISANVFASPEIRRPPCRPGPRGSRG
jgi:hypothetical protein